ncbi:hypothetical protein C7S17_1072 [Burkholderia thailandensis]|nr:hypothetical protein [Burkholderia thailandensis]
MPRRQAAQPSSENAAQRRGIFFVPRLRAAMLRRTQSRGVCGIYNRRSGS